VQTVLAVLTLSLSAQLTPPDARIAQVSDGRVDQKTYFNDAFEISFRIRDGWTIALTPAGTAQFAAERSAEDPVNRCSRALFSSEPIHSASRPFGPKVTYFVFDPECFPGPPFPESVKNRKAVTAFARRVVHALAFTPYIPPSGADFGGFEIGKRAFVTLTAEKNVELPGGITASPKQVHVNTLLMLTESNSYWVVMAAMTDDEAKKTIQASGVDVIERH
jgi:hypothetical protein